MKLLGASLLAIVFLALTAAIAEAEGSLRSGKSWLFAIGVWAVSAIITAVIALGLWLLHGPHGGIT